LPRLGYIVPKGRRTHIIQHHTVGVDSDATKNLWTDVAEVRQQMRRLQTIRPDLGDDIPYSFVLFGMENGDLYVCEGRGEDRTGAHTHGHNTEGIGGAWHGNFEAFLFARRFIAPASRFFGWLKNERGMVNLGTVHPAGRETYGHRDFRDPNDRRTWTACPGLHLYNEIGDFTIEEDDMPSNADQLLAVTRLFLDAATHAAKGGTLPKELADKIHYILHLSG
jgi:hypothetical protein